jgi:hypothetical protein
MKEKNDRPGNAMHNLQQDHGYCWKAAARMVHFYQNWH